MGNKQEVESKKFLWRRNYKYDLMLLCEVESKNPYAFNNQKPSWIGVANALKGGILAMNVTERSCRERTAELVKKHRKDELISIQTSGMSEEEMTHFRNLLTSVSKLEQEKPNKQLKVLYNRKDRDVAEAIRNAALRGFDVENPLIRERIIEEVEEKEFELAHLDNPDDRKRKSEECKDDDDDDDDFEFGPKKAKLDKSSNPKKDLITFLENKSEKEITVRREEVDIRREELRIREKEADNKAKELEILRLKAEAEIEERKETTKLFMKLSASKE